MAALSADSRHGRLKLSSAAHADVPSVAANVEKRASSIRRSFSQRFSEQHQVLAGDPLHKPTCDRIIVVFVLDKNSIN